MGFGNQHITIFLVSGFCFGIAAFFLISFTLFLIVSSTFFILGIIFHPKKILIIGCLCIVILGYVRAGLWQDEYGQGIFDNYLGQEVEFQGLISEEPDLREHNTRIIINIEDSDNRVLVVIPRYPEFTYGDIVNVSGEFQTIENFENHTGRIFDYQNYLKKDMIYYQMFYPSITVIGEGEGNVVKHFLLKTKHILLDRINRILSEPNASLLGGLLVGAKSSMGPELLDDFRKTGVVHIVVLSGFNVTIVAEFFVRIFAFLGLGVSALFGSVSIVLFAILTGASATIVRASIMALLVIVARVTGRANDVSKALFIAGGLMLLHNPMLLLYDPSFQLSFLATLGLIMLVPWLEKEFSMVPRGWFDFRGLVAASLAAQIFVTPLLIWMMGEVSIVSPIVNILILWVVPAVMLSGFMMVLVSFISSAFALPLITLTHFILSYILGVVDVFAQLPYASVILPSMPITMALIIYLGFFIIYFRYRGGRG